MIYKKYLLFGMVFTISLFSRENPFLPQTEINSIPISNNYVQAPDHFKKTTIKLPDSARILNFVEIVYQNIDGSISRKKVEIDKLFDWSKKLYLSYNFSSSPKKGDGKKVVTKQVITKTIKRRVSKTVNNRVVYNKTEIIKEKPIIRDKIKGEVAVTHYMNKDEASKISKFANDEKALGSLNAGSSSFNTSSNNSTDKLIGQNSTSVYSGSSAWGNIPQGNLPKGAKSIVEDDSETESLTIAKNRVTVSLGKPRFSQFEFDIKTDKIKISTTDKKSRHFMLVRPNRIVIDFIREVSFPNQTFEINQGVFGEMKVSKKGSSSYRVTIFLEDGYRYKLNRTEIGYNVKCFKR